MSENSAPKNSFDLEVEAAARVLKAALPGGGLVGRDDPEFVAHRMLLAAREVRVAQRKLRGAETPA